MGVILGFLGQRRLSVGLNLGSTNDTHDLIPPYPYSLGIKSPLQLLGSDESAQLGKGIGDKGRVGPHALGMRGGQSRT